MVYKVAVAGASGYAGGEVLRLLANHGGVEVVTVTAHSNAGNRLETVHPNLRTYKDMVFAPTTPEALSGHDIVFFALPHGQSGALSAALASSDPDALLIDCGADHRLEDPAQWEKFYGGDFHEPWTYGVPELSVAGGKQRERLVGTRRIAAPGCNASTVSLSLAPGVRAGLIDTSGIVATLAVGPSGAGRALKPHLLASELLGNAKPYSVAGTHRHIPEVEQGLLWSSQAGSKKIAEDFSFAMSFTPVLVPMARGILAVVSAPVAPEITEEELRQAWLDVYGDEEFVQVLPPGQMPQTGDTIGANTALMGIALDEAAGRVLVVTAVDNLVKGTAGAAIQSMNIALTLPETMGLTTNGVAP